MTDAITDFLKPRIVKVDNISNTHSRVVLEPFERGFGHTLGNALRRILLSSMQGSSVIGASIDGVLHEYSGIDGVQEDVLDILLNLKDMAIALHNRDEATLKLSKQGPSVVTAGDITLDHDVEVANPDHVIATLTKDIALNMTMKVRKGRGYEPATMREEEEDRLDEAFDVEDNSRLSCQLIMNESLDGLQVTIAPNASIRIETPKAA